MNLSWKRPDNVSFPCTWHSFEVTTKDGRTQKIQIEDVPLSKYDDVLDFMSQYYDLQAPIPRAIGGYSDQQILADKRAFRRKVLEQKISLIATAVDPDKRQDSSAKIVGSLLLYVFSKTDPPFEKAESLGRMNAIFRQLKKDTDIFTRFNCDKHLDEAGLAISSEYQGLGIGLQLVSCLPIIGKTFNIFGSAMKCSAIGSQIICEKLGFQLLKEIRYEDCKNEKGEPVLPGIEASSLKYMFLKFS